MNQELTIEKCSECPMYEKTCDYYGYYEYSCQKGAFTEYDVAPKYIDSNCPFKNNDTLTFKFQIDE